MTKMANTVFLRNIAWLGGSEAFVRVTRLLTAVVLARVLDPVTFGIAALVLTANELIHVFNRNGVTAKIVQCAESELSEVLETSYRVGFIVCGALFVIQYLLAYPIAQFYDKPELVLMLQVLALVYLMMPFALVQSALVLRNEDLKTKALIEGTQVGVDNLLTTFLAICGLGAWAIVLPKLLVAPIWIFGYRRAVQWHTDHGLLYFPKLSSVIEFSRYYLSTEILKTARLNIDNLIIARLLGVEMLGLYYFARNAGLGFSLSLINAVTSAMYPNLCKVKDNLRELKARFYSNLSKAMMISTPLIVLQAILAPWYVPLVFGEQWETATPILSLLCLSAVLRPLAESASTLAHATNNVRGDFIWNGVFTLLFIAAVLIGANISLYATAFAVLLVYTIAQPIYTIFMVRHVFAPKTFNNGLASQA